MRGVAPGARPERMNGSDREERGDIIDQSAIVEQARARSAVAQLAELLRHVRHN